MEELLGCWREAQRADKAVVQLLRIRTVLDLEFREHITAVLREIESSSRLLRDLYDLFPIYRSRVPIVIYYLDIILPSFERTIKNMMVYIDNDAFPARTQWTLMVERLGDQGGMSLPTRFVISPLYDPTTLELLRMRHLRLRLLQGIPAPPPPAIPHHAPTQPTEADLEKRRHWAEKIFDDQPHSTTGLRHRRESKCFGPPMVDIKLGITSGSRVLFKLPFDKNRLSVMLYLQPDGPNMTRLLCRWLDPYMNPLTACYGVHELCIRRKGSSLQFHRWSINTMNPKLWMALFFKTWEKMVLFHCAFGALKSRCPLTISVTSEDVCLPGETRLFQGYGPSVELNPLHRSGLHFDALQQNYRRRLRAYPHGSTGREVRRYQTARSCQKRRVEALSCLDCFHNTSIKIARMARPPEPPSSLAQEYLPLCLLPEIQEEAPDETEWGV